jgi:hypothetical protein
MRSDCAAPLAQLRDSFFDGDDRSLQVKVQSAVCGRS